MSKRWPGGIVTKTQATPTGPYQSGSAPGIWTLNQMSYWVKQALWPTAGLIPNYIEDVFSTYLYTGNGSTQTITNGIDLSGKGGLTWIKARSTTFPNILVDTVRGATKTLQTNATFAEQTGANTLTAFNTTGFSLGSDSDINQNNATYASWTFREQPKFFDVVTYTGTGANRTVAHNLGSVPGCIIIKGTNSTFSWKVYHRSTGNTTVLNLNLTDAAYTGIPTYWNSTTPTSTVFSLGDDASVNAAGNTYVAYLFAHNAGGFGLTGTENVISCGSFTTDGSENASVSLGYEPQFVMMKRTSTTSNWVMVDNMRGMPVGSVDQYLSANLSNAEGASNYIEPNATGFDVKNFGASATSIYIAIRRGPMQVPTMGTSVFSPITAASDPNNVNVGFPADLFLANRRNAGSGRYSQSRLAGQDQYLTVTSTAAEATAVGTKFDLQNYFTSATFYGGAPTISYLFKRAPGFFDVVCYTGTGVSRTVAHNLTVVPELMIVKSRSNTTNWFVYNAFNGNDSTMFLDNTSASSTGYGAYWNSTTPTASVFSVGNSATNTNAYTYVAYLFATVAGVSKVGSYTGTGATLNINAGFTTGARFVMIKRTDSTGSWFVWDTARGMVAGTDPRLALNTDAAESNANWVYTATSGFQIVTTDASVNASGGTYIYLAIA